MLRRTVMRIPDKIDIPPDEIEIQAVRSKGPGGQNVNKVSTAIHLRYDIKKSSLPEEYRERLLLAKDRRITKEGVIIIKARRFRTQEKNREDAIRRLNELILKHLAATEPRKATKPTKSSIEKRLKSKTRRAVLKEQRRKIDE